jgi:hypothetical protein
MLVLMLQEKKTGRNNKDLTLEIRDGWLAIVVD